jgi:hypothetical protein
MRFTIRTQLTIGILLITLTFLSYGCESGGSGSTEPLADEPMIVDSAMCINVSNDRPDGITNTFLSSDDRIYVWVYWTKVAGTSTAKAVWYQPDVDSAYREDSQVVRSESGFGITWFYLDKPAGGFNSGEWLLELYLDGVFQRSYLFIVS